MEREWKNVWIKKKVWKKEKKLCCAPSVFAYSRNSNQFNEFFWCLFRKKEDVKKFEFSPCAVVDDGTTVVSGATGAGGTTGVVSAGFGVGGIGGGEAFVVLELNWWGKRKKNWKRKIVLTLGFILGSFFLKETDQK